MKKAVMTIHGFLTDTKDFGRLYDYLDAYDEVKAVEIPGHCGEEPDFSQFKVHETFQTVLDAFDELSARNDQVDVIGFSMGGALTTWLCSVRNVHKAVLVSPANKYINAAMPLNATKFFGDFGLKMFKGTEGKFLDKIGATNTALSPYRENLITSGKIAKERALRYFGPHTYAVFSKIISNVDAVIETLYPIKTPVFILYGKLDELVPYKSIKYIEEHFPNATEKIYPDVGHAMLYTHLDYELIHDIVEYLSDGALLLDVPQRNQEEEE